MPQDACTAADGATLSASPGREARLPWYDFEFLRLDHRHLWQALRDRLIGRGVSAVPVDLAIDPDLDGILASPSLLVSQTCGYDIAVPCPAELQPVLTPIYAAAGCGHGTYSSFVVVRRHSRICRVRELSCARFVANDTRSWSGFHCMREIGATWADVRFSGSHLRSLEMIANDEADWAAIDAVDWALLGDHDPTLGDRFRILAVSREVPAPPLVTAMQTEPGVLKHLRESLHDMAVDPALQATLRRLRIAGFVDIARSAYQFMDLDDNSRRASARDATALALPVMS